MTIPTRPAHTMRTTAHRGLVRATLALASAVLLVWLTVWATGHDLDFVGSSLSAEEQERVRQLEEERVRTLRRIQARREVVAAVIARRMILPEAAGAFRELNRGLPRPSGRARGAAADTCSRVILLMHSAAPGMPFA